MNIRIFSVVRRRIMVNFLTSHASGALHVRIDIRQIILLARIFYTHIYNYTFVDSLATSSNY